MVGKRRSGRIKTKQKPDILLQTELSLKLEQVFGILWPCSREERSPETNCKINLVSVCLFNKQFYFSVFCSACKSVKQSLKILIKTGICAACWSCRLKKSYYFLTLPTLCKGEHPSSICHKQHHIPAAWEPWGKKKKCLETFIYKQKQEKAKKTPPPTCNPKPVLVHTQAMDG